MSGNNSGQSLTPLSRRQEIADASVNEGYLAALATFVPSTATVLFALKKFPNFAAVSCCQYDKRSNAFIVIAEKK